jgi:hypothetical protein
LELLFSAAVYTHSSSAQPLSRVKCASKQVNIRNFHIDLSSSTDSLNEAANLIGRLSFPQKCKITCNLDTEQNSCIQVQTTAYLFGNKVLDYKQGFEGGRQYAKRFVYGIDQSPLENFMVEVGKKLNSIQNDDTRKKLLDGIYICLVRIENFDYT